MRKILLLAFALFSLAVGTTMAQDTQVPNGSQYQLQEIANGFARPLLAIGANDGTNRLFVVDQDGHIWVMVDGAVQK